MPQTTKILDLCLFKLIDKVFGVQVSKINEIIALQEITPVPAAPFFLLGAINVRGDILPVVTVNHFLGLPTKFVLKDDCLIIIQERDVRAALLVNSVIGIAAVKKTSIHPQPGSGKGKVILGVCELNKRSITLVSPQELIALMQRQIREEG